MLNSSIEFVLSVFKLATNILVLSLLIPLILINLYFSDSSNSWTSKLLCSVIHSLIILFIVCFVIRLFSIWKAKRKITKEKKSRKFRIFNKLKGLKTPFENIDRVCLRPPKVVSSMVEAKTISAVDVLEAFQAKTLQLDQAISGVVDELLFDADVHAFMLEDETIKSKSLLSFSFYFNEGVDIKSETTAVAKLIDAGALPLATVCDNLVKVSSLLLNHGASFFFGVFPANRFKLVAQTVGKKPIYGMIVPGKKIVASMSADFDTMSRIARTYFNLPDSESLSDNEPITFGLFLLGARKSSTIGSKVNEDAIKQRLASVGHTLIQMCPADVKAGKELTESTVQSVLSTRRVSCLVIASGKGLTQLEQLATFMNIFVVPLPSLLTELYICVPRGHELTGLRLACDFSQ